MSEIDYDQRDPFDDSDENGASIPTCKHCGKTGLDWVFTGVRWRLCEGMKFHVCGNENAIDDFEVIE